MQLVELRLAQTYGTAFDDAGDDTTDGVTLGLHLFYQALHLFCLRGVGTAYAVGLCQVQVVTLVITVQGDVAHL